MRAVLLYGQGDVRVESVPDPTLQGPSDVIVRITSSAICESDLHPFHGGIPPDAPFSIGHEFVVSLRVCAFWGGGDRGSR